jgi:hypothetical protein
MTAGPGEEVKKMTIDLEREWRSPWGTWSETMLSKRQDLGRFGPKGETPNVRNRQNRVF